MSTKITNNPWEKNIVTYPWVYWDNAFTDEEIQEMCNYFAKHETEKGLILGEKDGFKPEDIRASDIKFHSKNENTSWIYDRFNWVIEQANDKFYNFELNGYDTMQYTEYDFKNEGKYDFHLDIALGQNVPIDMQVCGTRKLSITMALNEPDVDFTGGEFEISLGVESEKVELKKGRIILFPSFIRHRIKKVTSGKRKSLVIWIFGPKFK